MPKGSRWKQSAKRDDKEYFSQRYRAAVFMNLLFRWVLVYPLLQPSQQLTRTMGRTTLGEWAPGLQGSSNRSVTSRALHTPQALSLTLLPCGIVWVVGCCVGFSQLHGSSSPREWWKFSRAASRTVQSRWELKEQRAALKHFLGPQRPSSSLKLCLRTVLHLKNLLPPKLQMKEEYRNFLFITEKPWDTSSVHYLGRKKSLQVYYSLHLQHYGVKMLFQEALCSLWETIYVYAYLEWQLMCLWEDHCDVSCCCLHKVYPNSWPPPHLVSQRGQNVLPGSSSKDDTHNISFSMLKHHTHQEQ